MRSSAGTGFAFVNYIDLTRSRSSCSGKRHEQSDRSDAFCPACSDSPRVRGGGGGGGGEGASNYLFSENPDVVLENPEGSRRLDWCPWGFRDDVVAVDMNRDGVNDIISVFRCYRETHDGWWYTEVHDTDYPAAWMIWLSQADGSFRESTADLFGTNYLDVTDGLTGGAASFVRPLDINGDGHPDLVYQMSRDDTRISDDAGVLNPDPTWTWACRQSVVMSKRDGSYQVQIVGPRFSGVGTINFFRNQLDYYDLVGAGLTYDLAFRFDGGAWSDVGGEWDAKRN